VPRRKRPLDTALGAVAKEVGRRERLGASRQRGRQVAEVPGELERLVDRRELRRELEAEPCDDREGLPEQHGLGFVGRGLVTHLLEGALTAPRGRLAGAAGATNEGLLGREDVERTLGGVDHGGCWL